MRRMVILFITIMLTVVSVYVVPTRVQGAEPQLLADFNMTGSDSTKFPSVAAAEQTVYVGGGVNFSDAVVWTMNELATSSGTREVIGTAAGQSDYSTVALTTTSDGSLYAVWSNINEARVYMRKRTSAGVWGATYLVTSGGFPIFPQIAVTGNGQIFVIWQDLGVPLTLVISNNGGANWAGPYLTRTTTFSVPPSIAAGPNNQVVIGYTTEGLNVAAAIWNGSGLTTEIISTQTTADVSVSIGPDGKIYAAWRAIEESGPTSGAFFGVRQAAGSWSGAQVVAGAVKGSVNVIADSGGTFHLGWVTNITGSMRYHYTFRDSGSSSFVTSANSNSSGVFNARLAISSDGGYAHGVMENFSGGLKITYVRFLGPGQVRATPSIENGATYIKGQTSVSVSFSNPQGSPTDLRWHWGSAPTDADTWQAYASPITVTVPNDLLTAATCAPTLLYVQFRNAKLVVGKPQTDGVIFDTGVTASVVLANPHMMNRATAFSNLDDFSSDSGASDGHPGYTRDPQVYVSVQSSNECSGLKTLAIGRSSTTLAPALPISNNSFANILPISGFTPGSNTVVLQVTDVVGNSKDYSTTLVYDQTAPVLGSSPGSFSVSSYPEATILTSLIFTSISVTDTGYPGRGFWGVWIANSRSTVADPATDTSLVWYPILAPGSGTTFTITNWSLASGLRANQITTGDYYVYARFLDGAGNPTASAMPVAKVTLEKLTFPKINLPIITRR